MSGSKRTRFRKLFLWAPLAVSIALSCAAMLLLESAAPERASAQQADPRTALLWRAKCSSCHGLDGRGQTKQGTKMQISNLSTPAWQRAHTDVQIRTSIQNGIDQTKNGIRKKMDPFRTKLQPAQIEALIRHIRGLHH